MKLLLASLCLLGTLGLASAQDTPPAAPSPADQLPPPPWLNKAPDMSHWIVTYKATTQDSSASSSGSSSSGKTTPPKTVEVVKTGKTLWVKTTDEFGVVTEQWLKDENQITRQTGGVWFVGPSADPRDPFGQPDYVKSDFAGFDWITAQNFVGILPVNGDKCLVFRDKVLPLSDQEKGILQSYAIAKKKEADFSSYMVDAEADIDLATLLPIGLKIGNITRVFTYQAAPLATLELPPDAEAALAKYQLALAPLLHNSPGTP